MQRKVFRIEQNMAALRQAAPRVAEPTMAASFAARDNADAVQFLNQELADLQNTLARNTRELAALIGYGKDRRMARAAGELGAAVEAMEQATVTVLKSAETINEAARALGASSKSGYEHGLAQDIQERLIAIYEACNFQDIAGQRIGKVIETLITVDEQVSALLGQQADIKPVVTDAPAEVNLINGPRLDGDSGHASQRDIDAMFA